MTDRELMQQALEALESDPISHAGLVNRKQAIAVLRQVLKTEQEPVAWISESENLLSWDKFYDHMKPLYTAPPKKEWVGLTDEERRSIREWKEIQNELGPVWAPMMLYLYEAIEAKLKEKNHG